MTWHIPAPVVLYRPVVLFATLGLNGSIRVTRLSCHDGSPASIQTRDL